MNAELICRPPASDAEFEAYYELRFQVLRKPWGEPKGTERADDEDRSYHLAVFDQDEIVGVGRLHLNNPAEGQIRFMAVADGRQGHGIGRLLMDGLEGEARQQGATYIALHARQNAVKFYETLGYQVKEISYLLFGEIQHWLMTKPL